MLFAGNMIGSSRLRVTVWAILQTALAAGLAWYLTRDALGHTAPFFAPIAASVCMWATNVVRAQLALEMVVGVGLGIGLGSGIHALLGAGPVAMATVVLVSLSTALLIGRGFLQRPMFVNQTVISAILVLSFPSGGIGTERLFDALIGGSIAVVFSILLFPKNPLAVLRDARVEVWAALRRILAEIPAPTGDSAWILNNATALHRRLARLSEARRTAEQVAWICPRRWSLRGATRAADRQAAQLSLLAESVLHLARVTAEIDRPLLAPVDAAIGELATAAAALAADEATPAAAHAASARSHTVASETSDAALLTAAVEACIDEFDRVISLAPQGH